MKKILISFILFLSLTIFQNKNSKADFYQDDYDYNIFSADTIVISPYFYAGYALMYASHKNQSGGVDATGNYYSMDYRYMLRNTHNGFKLATGVFVNKNWLFELSYSYFTHKSSMRDKYLTGIYANISSIRATIMTFDLNIYMRLPFTFDRRRLSIYFTCGMDIINSFTDKTYRDSAVLIPSWMAKEKNRTAFALNIGGALEYNLSENLSVRTEMRKIFILSSSLLRDNTFTYSIGVGLKL